MKSFDGFDHANKIINALLFLMGMLLILWSTNVKDQYHSYFLIAIGSTLVGSGISEYLSKIKAVDFYTRFTREQDAIHRKLLSDISMSLDAGNRVLKDISELHEPGLTSEENAIIRFRKRLYHYQVTLIDSKLVWQLGSIDFSKSQKGGKLNGFATYMDASGLLQSYTAEGFVRDTRLLVILKLLDNDELCDICCFPFRTKLGVENGCGFDFHETWDRPHIACPSILSEGALYELDSIGLVANPEAALQLGTFWRKNFNKLEINVFVNVDNGGKLYYV